MKTVLPDFKRRKGSRGMGLLQLIVVVSIVAILMALLFPILGTAREEGRLVKCTSHLRRIYIASIAFAYDHDGKLPPALGRAEMEKIDSRFKINQYWWGQAYLGRYVLNDFNRRTDSAGVLSQDEAEVFNCPARMKDGPDKDWAKTNGPAVSYVMRFLGSSDPSRYRIALMQDSARKIYVTEGRSGTLAVESARSATLGEPSSSGARLRRYHRNGLNLLFFDGHIEPFFGPDEALAPMINLED